MDQNAGILKEPSVKIEPAKTLHPLLVKPLAIHIYLGAGGTEHIVQPLNHVEPTL